MWVIYLQTGWEYHLSRWGYKPKDYVKSVKVWKLERFKMVYMVKFWFNFNRRGSMSVSVQARGVHVRTWRIPSRQPGRRGRRVRPGRARCLPRWPCRPARLKERASVNVLSSQAFVPRLCCYSDGLLPFFKALSMSFSRSRACLFPGSFFRSIRMYFRAFSYSCGKKNKTGTEMRYIL